MRSLAIMFALLFALPSWADDGDWIGDVKPIVTPDDPADSVAVEVAKLRELVKRLQDTVDKFKTQAAMPMPLPEVCQCDCDCEQNTARIDAMEGRLARVEDQVAALVTVRQSDGSETTAAVEIDTVEGYGDFEVPVGGKVVAINGVRIRDHYALPTSRIYNTPEYFASPLEEQSRRIRIAPIRRAASVFPSRYYVDADGCTVDRMTGRKVSCSAR